jgi:perosamine synthetase
MNESQAAVGRAQLRKIDMLIGKRRENSHYLNEGFAKIKGVRGVFEDPDCYHAFHLFTMLVKGKELGASRDDFMRILYQEEGIQGIQHYQPNYHFSGLKKMYHYPDKLCPNAENFFYNEHTSLPMNPRLTKDDLNMIIEGVKNTVKKLSK